MQPVCWVTGLGVVTPLGIDVDSLWQNLLLGRSNFAPQKAVYLKQTEGFLAGRIEQQQKLIVQESVAALLSTDYQQCCFGDSTLYALYAAKQALVDACLTPQDLAQQRCAVILGNNEAECDLLDERLEGKTYRWLQASYTASVIADYVANTFKLSGPRVVIHNTCASSNMAIDLGQRMIQQGIVDMALVGGTDGFAKKVWVGFDSLRALGREPCQPFARQRRFITISEGAALLVLQSGRCPSVGRNANPYAGIIAVSKNNDAYHPTQPDYQGVLACHQHLFEMSATDAIQPEQIDVIYAHGTGTRANDSVEASVFNQMYPASTAVTAIKSCIGHMMATAGAVAAVNACLTISRGEIPPTNITADDFEYDFDLVLSKRTKEVNLVQSNAFGFGGNNAIALFGKYPS